MGKALEYLMETYTEARVDIQILFMLYPFSPERQKIHMEQDMSVSLAYSQKHWFALKPAGTAAFGILT